MMLHLMRPLFGAALMVGILLGAVSVKAESKSSDLPPPPPAIGEPNPKKIEKMREARGRLLREAVQLTEVDAVAVEKVLVAFDLEQREAKHEVRLARRQLHEHLDQGEVDQEVYRRAIERLRAAHEMMHRVKERRFDALLGVLPPQKTARLLVMLGKLHHERKRHKRRHRGKHQPER